MSRHIRLEINNFKNTHPFNKIQVTEQHREATPTRIERDTFSLPFLVKSSLFSDNPTLHNITTGIIADVKASNAEAVNTMVMKMYSVIFLF